MSRVTTAVQICLHAANRHGSCPESSQLHVLGMSISKSRWNYLKTASSFNEGKNHSAKTLTSHHTVEETPGVFPFSFHKINQISSSFSEKKYTRSLNSRCLMKNELYLQHRFPLSGAQFSCYSYSSDASGKTDGLQNATPTDYAKEITEKTNDSDWSGILNDAQQHVVGAVSYVGRRAKEVSNEVTPYMQQLYDSHPYLENVLIPVGGTMAATLLAWFVMPSILRKIHKYASRNPFALLSGSSIKEEITYEKSLWNALEDPARYLITFMAFYQL